MQLQISFTLRLDVCIQSQNRELVFGWPNSAVWVASVLTAGNVPEFRAPRPPTYASQHSIPSPPALYSQNCSARWLPVRSPLEKKRSTRRSLLHLGKRKRDHRQTSGQAVLVALPISDATLLSHSPALLALSPSFLLLQPPPPGPQPSRAPRRRRSSPSSSPPCRAPRATSAAAGYTSTLYRGN